ncbi:ImcF-related family protein [Burkholderia sp. Ac-20379]|uniref:ImcF-related family protein n=1 Tax=Burkholderia sp. Ac-20379 TaxID=2703900 RepID=UPI001980EAA8|nr:ImcF-related family protein [Burkholderia sp. Ac-20379]MBN3722845.1 type VI secretion protein VasK [Burkholderia sp. Ac-20379]
MTTPQNNSRNKAPDTVGSKPASGRVAIWGMPLAALVLAIGALLLVWFGNDSLGIADGAPRMRFLIGIPIALVVVVIAHLFAVSTGAYGGAARWFRAETGDRTKAMKPLRCDARLQRVYEALRVSYGWRWRRRLRWLLLIGMDERIDQVAPGLKQAGVMHVGETILVHTCPDGVDSEEWLGQIRKLRRRPIDGVVHVARAHDIETDLPRKLAGLAASLGWAAPVAFLHPVEANGNPAERFDVVGAFMPDVARRHATSAAARLPELLDEVEHRTADTGVRLSTWNNRVTWLMEISKYVGDHAARITTNMRMLAASNWLRAPLAGVLFAPVFPGTGAVPMPVAIHGDDTALEAVPMAEVMREQPHALLPVWHQIASAMPNYRGRRTRLYWPDALAWCVLIGAIAWIALLVVSGLGNRALVNEAEATAAQALATAPGTPLALRAQLALQNEIETLEYRRQHGAPWYLRAGLSRNGDLLDTLWRPYQIVASRDLRQPLAQALERQLGSLSQVRADEQQSHAARQRAYNRLKAYLMLVMPARAEAPFLKAQMLDVWPAPAAMQAGEWIDVSRQLAGFWADHLGAHPEWRTDASQTLVTQMRSTLVSQIGLAASDDMLYRRVLEAARNKYADVSLATLLAGADAHGMFTTTQVVPGIFTRAAWERVVEKAIDDAVKGQHIEGDWVLGDQAAAQGNAAVEQGLIGTARATIDARQSADTLRKRLRDRYFKDYTAAWATMLNSFQWIRATSFSGVIDQLTRLTDAQASPLLAVMRSVKYQGEAGRPSQALTDTLMRKARGLLTEGSDAAQPAVINPLDRSFGPLLALMGDAIPAPASGNGQNAAGLNAAAFSGVSLSRVLTADTTVRLKLQQIQASLDAQAMARSLAQAVFQGKLSNLSQARDDAALTAASVGAQWAGFGQTMFVKPLDAAWEAVLQPAAASLNDTWRAAVTAPFETSFASRYPFAPTSADASFAELGRYVRPDGGLINRFIQIELSGVLKRQGDQWVPDELAPTSLQFDPKFLAMLRLVGPLGARLYSRGEAGYHFELMPQPSPDVTHTELSVDGRRIVYFNQQDAWTRMAWPGSGLNGHASLTWQAQNAGVRIAFDETGDWAFLRLLEKAQVRPLDDTRYELIWRGRPDRGAVHVSMLPEAVKAIPASAGEPLDSTKPALRYVLRTQAGAGPLDLLKLRGFRMPERIFVTGRAGDVSGPPSMPPLPPELQP